MNESDRQEIDYFIAKKVWHFRELFDIPGNAENDRGIAEDFFYRGIRKSHRIFRELRYIYHDELQDGCLTEYSEQNKRREDEEKTRFNNQEETRNKA